MRPTEMAARVALIAAALGLGGARLWAAQQNRWMRQVEDQLSRAGTALRERGFRHAQLTRTAALNGEESEVFAVRLEPGVAYSIIGVCDQDCTGLSLVLSNAANNDVAIDRTSGSVPIVEITPIAAMIYRVRVEMVSCQMNPCWYGVAVYGKK